MPTVIVNPIAPWPHRRAYGLTLVCLALAAPAGAARIDGLAPHQPTAAQAVTPVLRDDRLELKLDQERSLTIAPWPAFLPQRFGPQNILGRRDMQLSGARDRLAFTRTEETQPWLLVGNGAGPASRLLGTWRLQLSGRLWSAANGIDQKILGHDQHDAVPALVRADRDRWCVYLLEARMAAAPTAAAENEARIMWAAWKLEQHQKRCPAQR